MLGRLLALCIIAAACSTALKGPVPVTADRTAPTWFRGAWKREWFKTTEDPTPHEMQIVRDLQTPTVFGSVRISVDRPVFPDAKSFDDLDDAQLAILLEQRGGFAGAASFDGDLAVWDHEIEFRPPSEEADTARLERLSPTRVLEKGLDGDFFELWWSMSTGDGKYLGIKIMNGKRTERMLVVVGDHFVYARNRTRDLPPARSLTALVAEIKATRAQIIEILDCEFSYGTIRSGRVPWEIRYSTLPWREGKPLDFANEIALDAAGAPVPRAHIDGWSVPVNTFAPDDLRVLFSP